MKKRVLIFLFIIGFTRMIAQIPVDQPAIKRFGLGLLIEHYEFKDINTSNVMSAPINKLIFTFSSKYFRIEPELGLRLKKQESNILFQFNIGSGIFGMYKYNRINLYAGLRLNLALGSYNWFDYKITQTRKSIAPTLGAEYFFCKHFSLGGEFSIKYTSTESSSIYSDVVIHEENDNSPFVGVVLRYYF